MIGLFWSYRRCLLTATAALSCPIRFADARGRMKGAMIRGVARDADLLALVPVSLF